MCGTDRKEKRFMADPTLLPDPTCLHLLQLESCGKVITATVKTTALSARCPLCDSRSEKVHSRYVRVLADLPWMSCAVRLVVHTRRFFCTNVDCQRKIFAERLPGVVAPYAHKNPSPGFSLDLDRLRPRW